MPTAMLTPVTRNPASHLTLMELSTAGLNDAGFPDMQEQSVPDHPQGRVYPLKLASGVF
jgi:hypothetical protein